LVRLRKRVAIRGPVIATAVAALALLLVGSAPGVSSDTIYTVAGVGVSGNSGDAGQATEAQIDQPRSMDITSTGGYV
jgi:hypothetical protein